MNFSVEIYFTVFMVTLSLMGVFAIFNDATARKLSAAFWIPLFIVFALMIAARPIFSDSLNYEEYFVNLDELNKSIFEIGFYYYTLLFSKFLNWYIYILSFPIVLFFSSVALYRGMVRTRDYGLIVFCLVGWPFFWAYSATGFRQSLAISLGLLAVLAFSKRKLISGTFIVFIATLFHTSAAILFVVSLSAVPKIATRNLVALWGLSVLAAPMFNLEEVVNYLPEIVTSANDYAHYFDPTFGESYRAGIRADFVLFSSIPLILNYLRRNNNSLLEKSYQKLFHCYLLLNLVANLFSSIPFSDRVYSYSWALAPILIASIWRDLPQPARILVALLLYFLAALYSPRWIGI